MREIPAVSVVIPLYNAGKYIGECLDSLLAQTFQNFEVVVVDDCSTDNSAGVVESYRERFGGRLKLIKTQTNSGGPGIPRNLGVRFSRGEYLSIIDNDDALTPTAIEELYALAKDYDADVVHCEKFFSVPEKDWQNEIFRKNLVATSDGYSSVEYVKAPTFLTEDIATRLKLMHQVRLVWNLWSKLIRRNLWVENELCVINYPYEDMLCTCHLMCCAKRYLLVPNIVNYYRVRDASLSHETQSPQEKFRRYVRSLTCGFDYLEKFSSKYKFFDQYPDAKLTAADTLLNGIFANLDLIKPPLSLREFDEILCEEVQGAPPSLSALIFRVACQYRFMFRHGRQRTIQLNQFAAAAQKRIADLEAEVKRLKGEG